MQVSEHSTVVEYVILSEFDVDKGSCVRAQFPASTIPKSLTEQSDLNSPGKSFVSSYSYTDKATWEHYIADQMLPDGADRHSCSRTMFALNRTRRPITLRCPVTLFGLQNLSTTPQEEEKQSLENAPSDPPPVEKVAWVPYAPAKGQDASLGVSDMVIIETERNLLTIRRGLTDIVSKVFVPPENMQPCPQMPSDIINTLSLPPVSASKEAADGTSAAPEASSPPSTFVIIKIDRNSCWGLLFEAKHYTAIHSYLTAFSRSPSSDNMLSSQTAVRIPPSPERSSELTPLFGYCAVVTRKDTTVRRGGVSKSIALMGPNLTQLSPFFSLMVEAVEKCCEIKGSDESSVEEQRNILKIVYDAVNGVSLPSSPSSPELVKRHVALYGGGDRSSTIKAVHVSPMRLRHTVSIPSLTSYFDFPLSRFDFTALVEKFDSAVCQMIQALLTEKRIFVIGRQVSATDVCEAVMALGILGSTLDPDFINVKVFPYASINSVGQFSNVSGCIVGTLNPMFENQKLWWDVLCDLDSGAVTVRDGATTSTVANAQDSEPAAMTKTILREVRRMRAMLRTGDDIDQYVRHTLCDYIRILAIAATSRNQIGPHIKKRYVEHNESSLVDFVGTGLCEQYTLHRNSDSAVVMLASALLRCSCECEEFEVMQQLQFMLRQSKQEDDIMMLLRYFPLSMGGLGPIATQLFHPSLSVRLMAVALLRRIDSYALGKQCISKLNSYLMLAYEQASKDLPDTSSAY